MSSSDEKSETGGSDKTPTPMGNPRFAQVRSGGDVSSGGFAARAQGAGDCNANAGSQQGTGEKK
ncbi:unnamed protein product [Alternaria alternata]